MPVLSLHQLSARAILALCLGLSFVPVQLSADTGVASADERAFGATLSVLAWPVEIGHGDGSDFRAAVNGDLLNAGDMVRTGADGLALVTFFDGSETQLGSSSAVEIERAEATPAPQIAFMQTAGVSVNHVVPLPPGGSFHTDTATMTGLVRGTSYIVVVGSVDDQDTGAGSAITGVPVSIILLTDRDGHVGHVDVTAPGSDVATARLVQAGAAATASAGMIAPWQVDETARLPLEAAANTRADIDGAMAAQEQALNVTAAAVPDGTLQPLPVSASPSTTAATAASPSTTAATPASPSTTAAPPASPSTTAATPASPSTTAAPPASPSTTAAPPASPSTTAAPPASPSTTAAPPASPSTT